MLIALEILTILFLIITIIVLKQHERIKRKIKENNKIIIIAYLVSTLFMFLAFLVPLTGFEYVENKEDIRKEVIEVTDTTIVVKIDQYMGDIDKEEYKKPFLYMSKPGKYVNIRGEGDNRHVSFLSPISLGKFDFFGISLFLFIYVALIAMELTFIETYPRKKLHWHLVIELSIMLLLLWFYLDGWYLLNYISYVGVALIFALILITLIKIEINNHKNNQSTEYKL